MSDSALTYSPVLRPSRQTVKDHNKAVLLWHDPYCWWCGERLDCDTATLDHLIPKCRGGRNKAANYVLMCETCNRWKANRVICELPMNYGKRLNRIAKQVGYHEEYIFVAVRNTTVKAGRGMIREWIRRQKRQRSATDLPARNRRPTRVTGAGR